MQFTSLSIASLEPSKTVKTIRSSVDKGFAIKVSPAGSKTFLYIFKRQGKTVQRNLGRYPDVSVDDARLAYLTYKNGKHATPKSSALDLPKKSEYSIKEAWRDYEREVGHSHLSLGVRKQYGAIIYEFINIRGNLPVVRLDGRLIKEYLRLFKAFKTKPNKIKVALSTLCKYLVEIDKLDTNPCVGLPTKASKPKTRKFSREELQAFLPILNSSDVASHNKDVLKIILLTLARVSEAANMEVSELDLERSRWILPAARSKNGKEMLIALPQQAVALLKPRIADSKDGYVFTSSKGSLPSRHGVRQALMRLCEAAGCLPTSSHDLRRTAAHHINSLGVPSDLISKLMNHSPSGVTATTYIQASLFDYEVEKRQALETWSETLTQWGL